MGYNQNMKDLEKVLKALANERRLKIIKILKRSPELSVGEVAEEIGLSFRSTSRHLTLLYRAGVLEQERRANLVEYKIASPVPQVLGKIFSLIL